MMSLSEMDADIQIPWELSVLELLGTSDMPFLNKMYRVDGRVTRIGRDARSEIVLDHPTVSPRHVVLTCAGSELSLTNAARNGTTIVNGLTLARLESVNLQQAEHVVQLGDFKLMLKRAGPTKPSSIVYEHGQTNPDRFLSIRTLVPTGEVVVSMGGSLVTTLPPRAARLLLVLAEHASKPVTYYDAVNALAPDGSVDRSELPALTLKIRKAMDHALSQHPEWGPILESRDVVPAATGTKKGTWGHRLLETKTSSYLRLRLDPQDARTSTVTI